MLNKCDCWSAWLGPWHPSQMNLVTPVRDSENVHLVELLSLYCLALLPFFSDEGLKQELKMTPHTESRIETVITPHQFHEKNRAGSHKEKWWWLFCQRWCFCFVYSQSGFSWVHLSTDVSNITFCCISEIQMRHTNSSSSLF